MARKKTTIKTTIEETASDPGIGILVDSPDDLSLTEGYFCGYRNILSLIAGRSCLVVGSSPTVGIPDYLATDIDVVIGANGGAAIAHDHGLKVDILATTSYLFRPLPTDQETYTVKSLGGLSPDYVLVDEQCGPLDNVRAAIWDRGIEHSNEIYGVGVPNREDVVYGATGGRWWVSTGVWAICLALSCNANRVMVTGISPGVSGHHGMELDTLSRQHNEADKACLAAMVGRNVWRAL